MSKAPVFFIDLRTTISRNMSKKILDLVNKAGIAETITKNDLVAVKIHFGEKGNTAFVRPIFVRDIIDIIYACGGKPFLTDANTLYRGERGEAVSHTKIALEHGFSFATVAAPLIIADGLRGNDYIDIPVNKKHFKKVSIASAIVQSDTLISVAHFKGHDLTGFGGALKNLGMGCASRQGKLQQHSNISPQIKAKKCKACGKCAEWCPADAISQPAEKYRIAVEHCIGCAECITICPHGAVDIKWNESVEVFQEKMIEYTLGALKDKYEKSFFVNFLLNISPACDCYGHADRPFVPDIGILASRDPLAIDQASVDLVNAEQGYADSALNTNHTPGRDKFRGIYPEINWEIQMEYAQKLGLGTRNYELIRL